MDCHGGLVVLFGAVDGSKVVGGVGGGTDKLGWVYFDPLPPPCAYFFLAVQDRQNGTCCRPPPQDTTKEAKEGERHEVRDGVWAEEGPSVPVLQGGQGFHGRRPAETDVGGDMETQVLVQVPIRQVGGVPPPRKTGGAEDAVG